LEHAGEGLHLSRCRMINEEEARPACQTSLFLFLRSWGVFFSHKVF